MKKALCRYHSGSEMSYFFTLNLPTIMLILSGITFFILLFYLTYISQELSSFERKNTLLEKAISELDGQAKLIIKNDMELKLYQDAVHDKLKKLSFLKNFIDVTINILDRKALFAQIDKKMAHAIGFENVCILTFPELEIIVNAALSPSHLETFKTFTNTHHTAVASLTQVSSDLDVGKDLKRQLSHEDFLIGPIITEAHVQALFILHKSIISGGMTEAEKEVCSILCMYLGQCLNNINSFEALYRTGEELENKVKRKTFELTKTLDEMEKISKHKSDFISSVSHELRTPLTSIKGFSSLLVAEKFGVLPQAAKERLKKIDDNVNKLVDMVNTLLDIARIESRRIELNIVPSDVCKLIRDAADFLSPQMKSKQLQFEVDAPPELFVYMDKRLIERVFINLINNALKFTPPEGKITIQCNRHNDEATVSVSDTGYGIPQQDLEKIFQEFYRVDNPMNREIRGSGLGLSLVKRIIELHTQRIWVESEINKGTTFYFTLKVVENA